MTRSVTPKVQGTAPKRAMVKAGDAARAGGWIRGTMLRSKKWSGDRRVENIEGQEIELRTSYDGGSSKSWVKSIPEDAVAVSL